MALASMRKKQALEWPNNFSLIPQKVMEKYNKESVTQIFFTLSGLELLKKKYRDIQGLPPFLHHTMKGRPTSERNLVLSNKNLCAWTADHRFFIIPNYCTDYNAILKDPLAIKNSKHGLGLVAWWVAPQLFKKYGLSKALEEKTDDAFQKFLFQQDPTKNVYPDYKFFRRSDSQETIGELENKEQECPYLASILDLTSAHINPLENLKKTYLAHLEKVYGVDVQKDKVELYFHFPYPDNTTTLHLHARINFERHPMEISRSFALDEIISALRQGKSIMQLILERATYFTDNFDILHNIPGITLKEARNPYVISIPSFQFSKSS